MHIRALSLIAASLWLCCTPLMAAEAAPPDAATLAALAPTGVLRAAINLGNSVLAQQDAAGELHGVSVDLARALGRSLGVPVRLVVYHEAGATFAGGQKGEWDVAFLAIDPQRAEQVDFTAPYVVIDGAYMVWADSAFKTSEDLDRDGVRIAAPKGSAYELYLTRTLKHASLVRTDTVAGAPQSFADQHLEAVAGIGAALRRVANTHPEWRVITPGFQTIRQALVTPKGRAPQGLTYLSAFVERMKASGFVRQALDNTGQVDADVAPPAN
ncbi:MAG TPA: transporter substrate-binding domain-containing protein [Caulobacteraceae bacterium]|nr:transporter substrate-binding domain-containing protein [Caulobacteraceae bacterium]